MILSILLIGVVTAMAVFAILVKTCAGDPNQGAEGNKGDILKLLLAKSERELSENRVEGQRS